MVEIDSETSVPSPISNPDLFDHSVAENEFLSSFNSGRLAHAWLITGPKGIGKATLSHRIARFILTRNYSFDNSSTLFKDNFERGDPQSLAVDITNPVCRRIISGGHPDFLNIERSVDDKTGKLRKEITIDAVRDISLFLTKTPAEGGWRVIIIDNVDELNFNAANAVLKVLEEPPKQALILLVSNNPARLLPTIRSRCRRLSLNLLSNKTIKELLIQNNAKISPENLDQLVDMASGSFGHALELSKEGGFEIYREVNDILNMMPEIDLTRIHQLGDKLNRDKTGKVSEHTFDLINHWLVKVIKDLAKSKISSLDGWFEIWENTGDLFNKTKRLNLDTKQTILSTLIAIKNITGQLEAKQ